MANIDTWKKNYSNKIWKYYQNMSCYYKMSFWIPSETG